MSRTSRLLELLQILRGHRYPVTGAALAAELGISVRTLYRDVATLQQQGADIQGEPGMGYVLQPGFLLPPLMLHEDEIEALVLGARWVSKRADMDLRKNAQTALAKIAAVLPSDLRHSMDSNTLVVAGIGSNPEIENVAPFRRAMREQRKLQIRYRDLGNRVSTRLIWPIALGYFSDFHMIVAWCELRGDFRHFRTERILDVDVLEQRYPRRRQTLYKEWQKADRERETAQNCC